MFALQFLQARNPDWVRRPFYAKFDPEATWLDDLVPAFGEKKFFFETDQDEVDQKQEHKVVHMMERHDTRATPVVAHAAVDARTVAQS